MKLHIKAPATRVEVFRQQLRWWLQWRPTARYLMETEAHVYALAISASVLLSFYPFVIVMLSFCRNILHWKAAEAAIFLALDDFLPGDVGEFVRRNLPGRGTLQITSMILLLFTANGVFEPLEVALNRAWGVTKNRPYWRNQLVALGMIFACGGLALLSFLLTALNTGWMADWGVSHAAIQNWINMLFFKLAALPISILALFLVYWLLPNRKIEPVRVAPVAILVGLILEALKYVNLLVFPLLRDKLQREYGVFRNSVTILLWSFAASLVVLAGAEWSARAGGKDSV
ncbi:MAG TPA: YihY/virulence factor BrkB family protein [Bryobacteraceae bacterium]|nr:YihY/virulence factor BrkB family protein [Bryobacteraceae bacterium]